MKSETMNPEHLQALLVDRHFGELDPATVSLLEHYLSHHPEAREEDARVKETLAVTGLAVARYPEVVARLDGASQGCAKASEVPALRTGLGVVRPAWLKLAAALGVILLSVGTGILFERTRTLEGQVIAVQAAPAGLRPVTTPELADAGTAKGSPWARYRVTPASQGTGLQLWRLEPGQESERSVR
jgi:hypothetical protein